MVNDRDEIFVRDDLCIRKFERTGRHVCDIGYRHFIKPFGKFTVRAGLMLDVMVQINMGFYTPV